MEDCLTGERLGFAGGDKHHIHIHFESGGDLLSGILGNNYSDDNGFYGTGSDTGLRCEGDLGYLVRFHIGFQIHINDVIGYLANEA